MSAPRWTRIVVGVLGGVALALAVTSVVAPTALFGRDSYRIPVRVATGLLAATAGGLGVAALLAAIRGGVQVLQLTSLALLVTTAVVPAVVLRNVGYFDTVASAGLRALLLAVGASLLAAPLILNLRVLHRSRRAAVAVPD